MLDASKCCGCNNCVVLCPTYAITLKVNEYGFEEPIIDEVKCIKCGKCVRNCPGMNHKEKNIPQKVYAVWSKEEQVRKSSASGGISIELARNILTKGGVVYGTTFHKGDFVHVKRIDSLDNLYEIQGSRYVKSNMGETIKLIQADIKERKVLFLGTPCQCSAVKNVVGKHENLLLVDLICHGTPPQTYLREEMKVQGYAEEVENIQFRKNGRMALQFFVKGKEVFSEQWGKNYYFNAFMNALTYQETCYSCQYASTERIGNLTIGDFWGLDREWERQYAPGTGVSLVMENDEIGEQALQECKECIEFHERTLEEAVNGNVQLRRPSMKHKAREQFMQDYKKHGYKYAMRKNLFVAVLKKKVKYLLDKKAW